MAYTMIAERNSQKVRKERESALIVLANARVMQSEGWQVVIVDSDGTDFDPRTFEASVAAVFEMRKSALAFTPVVTVKSPSTPPDIVPAGVPAQLNPLAIL